ncbi:hypothetical protein D9M68_866280 [compost metagenome]
MSAGFKTLYTDHVYTGLFQYKGFFNRGTGTHQQYTFVFTLTNAFFIEITKGKAYNTATFFQCGIQLCMVIIYIDLINAGQADLNAMICCQGFNKLFAADILCLKGFIGLRYFMGKKIHSKLSVA